MSGTVTYDLLKASKNGEIDKSNAKMAGGDEVKKSVANDSNPAVLSVEKSTNMIETKYQPPLLPPVAEGDANCDPTEEEGDVVENGQAPAVAKEDVTQERGLISRVLTDTLGMGNFAARFTGDYGLVVKTGDRKGAGTDANIYAQLRDESGKWTLEVENFGRPNAIRIWRDRKGMADDWYLEEMIVIERSTAAPVVSFPINRWIPPDRQQMFLINDCQLPHLDERVNQRSEELSQKRQQFEYTQHWDNCPALLRNIPPTENAPPYLKDQKSFRQKMESKFIAMVSYNWKDLSDLNDIYRLGFTEPQCVSRWKDDVWFGAQRLQGLNPLQIKLCVQIPESFRKFSSALSAHLEGLSLDDACKQKRLFVVDFDLLRNLPCKDDKMIVAPIGLFFVNRKQDLVPVGIRLFPGESHDNPMFTPADPPYTWMMAKMYFNNADATIHRVWNSLGLTHFLMESIWVCTNRTLSPSHPIFRLLAPFFQNIFQANVQLLEKLMAPGGWLDQNTITGVRGMSALMSRCFKNFRLRVDLNLPHVIENQGLQKDILPKFPFRDDGLLVYECIHHYVTKVINHHYANMSDLVEDGELRDWHSELSNDRKKGGCEIKGLPENQFKNTGELIDVLTDIIAGVTMYNSAYNQAQYDECAFLPNYPIILRGTIPRSGGVRTEADIVNHLPSKESTMQIMSMLRNLSGRSMHSIGKFPIQYLTHPKDEQAHKEFEEELVEISKTIKEKNNVRRYQYTWLDPDVIPNGIVV